MGTIILAAASFWNIYQNYKLREKERKERILDEIIDWAIDVSKLDSNIHGLTESIRLNIALEPNITIPKLRADILICLSKGDYIEKIVSQAVSKATESIKQLLNDLSVIANLLDTFRIMAEINEPRTDYITTEDINMNDTNPEKDTVERHRNNLSQSYGIVIGETTRLKTQGIS